MSVGTKLLQAAAGNAGEAVYVDDVFSTYLYEGTGADNHIITNGIDLLGEGGLVWIKNRDQGDNHILVDTERGRRYTLSTNNTDSQVYDSDTVASFYSDGFRLRQDQKVNTSGEDYVSWTFRKQPGFFDVVTYTGNSTSGRTVSHNLGSVPGMIIVKRTDSTGAWQVYHRGNTSNPETDYLVLNTDAGTNDSLSRWNDTAPTSTEFTLGNSATVNYSGGTYVAYLFAHDEQDFGEDSDEAIIKCGSYVGNGTGSSSTQHIDLGFEPQFFLVKVAHNSIGGAVNGQSWFLVDTMRGFPNNGNDSNDLRLMPNDTASEFGYQVGHPTATGIQINGNEPEVNTNNNTYVYMAIARPHKPASEFAATDLFSVKEDQPASGGVWEHTHLTDMSFYKWQNGAQAWGVQDRLRGAPDLSFNSTSAENGLVGGNAWDVMTGYLNSNPGAGAYTSWAFRRAKGFFDVVTYEGNGTSGRTVSHNLGVKPELLIVKRRDANISWVVYNKTTGATKVTELDSNAGSFSGTGYWNDTEPTATNFTLGNSSNTNVSSGDYVAYLFASVEGICKIGTYTGNGTNQDIDCGFSSGARLVLLRRTDAAGNWWLFDSVRGIVAGNDPGYQLNRTNTEETGDDAVDPYSAGFNVRETSTVEGNTNSGTYIFLAIA